MKTPLVIVGILLMVAVSCKNGNRQNDEKADQSGETTKITTKTKTAAKDLNSLEPAVDTTTFEYLLELSSGFNEIPKNLIRKYIDEDILTHPYNTVFGTSKPYYMLDSVYVVTFSYSSLGVSSEDMVFTYSKNHEIIDRQLISSSQDQDLSNPRSSCSIATFINDTLIKIIVSDSEIIDLDLFKLVNRAPDLTIDGWYLPAKSTEFYEYAVIQPNGKINMHYGSKKSDNTTLYGFTSRRLITRDELDDLHRIQMRIIRNEIFARHGYVFESRDLIDYFWAKPWYKPVDENDRIMSKLNWIEKANVRVLKEREENKNAYY